MAEEVSRASSAMEGEAGSVAPYTPSSQNMDEHADVSVLRCFEVSLEQVRRAEEASSRPDTGSRPVTVGTNVSYSARSVSVFTPSGTESVCNDSVSRIVQASIRPDAVGSTQPYSGIVNRGDLPLPPSPSAGPRRPRPVRVPAKDPTPLPRAPLSARAQTESELAAERRRMREGAGPQSAREARRRPRPEAVPEEEGCDVVLRCEDRAEEWHQDMALHASRVGEQKALGKSHARREARARDLAVEVTRQADTMADIVCEKSTAEDLARAAELSRLREDLVEVRMASEQARDDCREYVASMEQYVMAERQKRQDLEAELREERKQSEFARRRVDEIEQAEVCQLRHLDATMTKRRASTQAEIHRMQHEADEEARAIEEEMRGQLAALQRELDEAVREARSGVTSHLQQKRTVRAAAEMDVKAVDQQVRVLLGNAHQRTLEMQEDTFGKVQEIQARDFEQEAGLRQHMDALWAAVGCAEHETTLSAKLEHESKRRILETTDALGAIYPRSTDFKLHSEKKVRSALAASGQFCVARSP